MSTECPECGHRPAVRRRFGWACHLGHCTACGEGLSPVAEVHLGRTHTLSFRLCRECAKALRSLLTPTVWPHNLKAP